MKTKNNLKNKSNSLQKQKKRTRLFVLLIGLVLVVGILILKLFLGSSFISDQENSISPLNRNSTGSGSSSHSFFSQAGSQTGSYSSNSGQTTPSPLSKSNVRIPSGPLSQFNNSIYPYLQTSQPVSITPSPQNQNRKTAHIIIPGQGNQSSSGQSSASSSNQTQSFFSSSRGSGLPSPTMRPVNITSVPQGH